MKFTRIKGMCHCDCNEIIYKDIYEKKSIRFFYEKLGWFQTISHCLDCCYDLELVWEPI